MNDLPTSSTASKVLIVDDDPIFLRSLQRVLSRLGYGVEAAASAHAALDALVEGRFDAVISDVSMPGLDGIGFLQRVRERDGDLPVVLITGVPDLTTASLALEHRAFAYLTKPFCPQRLAEVAEKAVVAGRAARNRRAREAASATEQPDLGALSASLDAAMASLWVAYQPIVSLGGAVFGYEALLRSDEKSLPHPGAILDAAERLGRLEDLGRAIRARAAEPLEQAEPDALLFVNLHTADLLDPALTDPDAPLSRIAHRVVLEITERASLDRVRDLRVRIARLREMGFRVAVDDLGAGYAGLTTFASLEPEIVKFDMSLVRDIHKNATKQKLCRSILGMCREMGIAVISEGVETLEERDMLASLGAELMQGYLYAKPGRAFPKPRLFPAPVLPQASIELASRDSDPEDQSQGARSARERLVGTTVADRWVIDTPLGADELGLTFAGHHSVIQRRVIIRVLQAPGDEPRARRNVEDALATGKIDHPNVVGMVDMGDLPDGSPYLVLDNIEGPTVGDVLAARGALPFAAVLDLGAQIAQGLGAAHARGIKHGALGLDSVVLVGSCDRDTRAVIVDIGAARQPGRVSSRPAVLAPEQVAGAAPDVRSDVFAFGALLAACRRPAAATDAPARALDALTRRCQAREPEKRYANMAEVVRALEAVPHARHAAFVWRLGRRMLAVAAAAALTSAAALSIAFCGSPRAAAASPLALAPQISLTAHTVKAAGDPLEMARGAVTVWAAPAAESTEQVESAPAAWRALSVPASASATTPSTRATAAGAVPRAARRPASRGRARSPEIVDPWR